MTCQMLWKASRQVSLECNHKQGDRCNARATRKLVFPDLGVSYYSCSYHAVQAVKESNKLHTPIQVIPVKEEET